MKVRLSVGEIPLQYTPVAIFQPALAQDSQSLSAKAGSAHSHFLYRKFTQTTANGHYELRPFS
jgi:hypothetical protein